MSKDSRQNEYLDTPYQNWMDNSTLNFYSVNNERLNFSNMYNKTRIVVHYLKKKRIFWYNLILILINSSTYNFQKNYQFKINN